MKLQLRTPTQEEFLKIAEFSFQNFVEETAQPTGEDDSKLKVKLGGPPTKIRKNDIRGRAKAHDRMWKKIK
jgi:hypothetical protein